MQTYRIIILLFVTVLFSACERSVHYYKRGEAFVGENVNTVVDSALQCASRNKGKSYCADKDLSSQTKDYREELEKKKEELEKNPNAHQEDKVEEFLWKQGTKDPEKVILNPKK